MKFLILPDSNGRDRVAAAVATLDPKKKWSIEIKLYRKPKTNAQLAYYHAVIVRAFAEVTGAEHDDMHEYLLGEYFGWVDTYVYEKHSQKPARTLTTPSQLGREEMTEFIEWCLSYGAKRGIFIPNPNEVIA